MIIFSSNVNFFYKFSEQAVKIIFSNAINNFFVIIFFFKFKFLEIFFIDSLCLFKNLI